jgi:hypothetical protein
MVPNNIYIYHLHLSLFGQIKFPSHDRTRGVLVVPPVFTAEKRPCS